MGDGNCWACDGKGCFDDNGKPAREGRPCLECKGTGSDNVVAEMAALRTALAAEKAARESADASARLWKETAQEALSAREKAEAAEFLNSSTTVIRLRDELAAEKARADNESKNAAALLHDKRLFAERAHALEVERDALRAQLARVRAETLEEAAKECDRQAASFKRAEDRYIDAKEWNTVNEASQRYWQSIDLARAIRALDTKTEGGGT